VACTIVSTGPAAANATWTEGFDQIRFTTDNTNAIPTDLSNFLNTYCTLVI
jgi:hypothetical protein